MGRERAARGHAVWQWPFEHKVFTRVGTSSTNSSNSDLILSSMYYRVIHCDRFFAVHHGKLEGGCSLVVASFGAIRITFRRRLVSSSWRMLAGKICFVGTEKPGFEKVTYDHLAAANSPKTWQTVMRMSYSQGEYQHPTNYLRNRIILALVSYWIGRGCVDVIPKT